MSAGDPVVAIACADIHLSHQPPIARVKEKDWYAAMKRPLDAIRYCAEEFQCPVLCAGDIFHHWKAPPELINFAIDHLPSMYAVPGQHDLPFHDLSLVQKSAYWTLVRAGVVTDLSSLEGIKLGRSVVYGFAWGQPISDPRRESCLKIAVIHRYLWSQGYSYPGASEDAHVSRQAFSDYNVVVSGDNHKGFRARCGKTIVFNCGGLMRRASDEFAYTPTIGLILESGEVVPVPLNTTHDCMDPVVSAPETEEVEFTDFLEQLDSLQAEGLDFAEMVRRYIRDKKPRDAVAQVLVEVIESGKP